MHIEQVYEQWNNEHNHIRYISYKINLKGIQKVPYRGKNQGLRSVVGKY